MFKQLVRRALARLSCLPGEVQIWRVQSAASCTHFVSCVSNLDVFVQLLNLDLNSQSAQLNPMLYQNLLQANLQGLSNFNSSTGNGALSQLPNNSSQSNNSAGAGFDLLNLQQM